MADVSHKNNKTGKSEQYGTANYNYNTGQITYGGNNKYGNYMKTAAVHSSANDPLLRLQNKMRTQMGLPKLKTANRG